ncbi:glycosyltransferase [Butyrivibrio sp. NC3005]|uniref:glycosyltransferase n=1 Tax=Butyrivibrio sp. NC3005 TaxID=1280685 RepID=UPI0003FAA681|nr:glycosyltransferase [Butyrivibrio sp. NC3005]
MTIWMDLTFSMKTWRGKGIVGIVRAELELAQKLHGIDNGIRYFVVEKKGFRELKGDEIDWMFKDESVSNSYMERWPIKQIKEQPTNDAHYGLKRAYNYLGRYTRRAERVEIFLKVLIKRTPMVFRWFTALVYGVIAGLLKIMVPIVDKINSFKKKRLTCDDNIRQTVDVIPFNENDTILSCGWYDNGDIDKEYAFSELKNRIPDVKLIYLVYDLVMVNPDTAALYSVKYEFEKYLQWISNNCDYVCYGGKTAKEDSEKYWKEHDLRIPQGKAVKFGSDFFGDKPTNFIEYKKSNHIEDNFILAVGSVDVKKNYDVLYKAFCIIEKKYSLENCPQLLIIGGKINGKNTITNIELTPKIKDKIRILRPSDNELDSLYENCLFTVLPTWYEGWSLTLPEALGHGKLCLASDVKPLKEIGMDLIEYADPADPYEWADRIYELANNKETLREYEADIKKRWKKITWMDSANMVYHAIEECNSLAQERKGANICFDMTLAYNNSTLGAPVSGILRTELTLLRYLCRIYPSMRLFAFTNDGPTFISRAVVENILGNGIIDEEFKKLGWYLDHYGYLNNEKTIKEQSDEDFFWLLCSVVPKKLKKVLIKRKENFERERRNKTKVIELPFKDGDIFLSVGIGFGNLNYDVYDALKKQNRKSNFKYIQLLYDFTPVLFPQFHHKSTRDSYGELLRNTYSTADFMLYGGKNAEKDGHKYEVDNNLRHIKSAPVYFGGDKVGEDPNEKWEVDQEEAEKTILKELRIRGKFVLVVGTIEPRKNHESLYLAYLHLLKSHEELPQMVFAGFHGWNMDEFVERVQRDERVRNKIVIITPSDKELDVLYRNCMFTVLASLYEGWSLTLPESLSRGKFCLCCDTPPLKEIAGDLADYVEGFDIKTWAEKIYFYYSNKEALSVKEKAIKDKWHVITWKECAMQVAAILEEQMEA